MGVVWSDLSELIHRSKDFLRPSPLPTIIDAYHPPSQDKEEEALCSSTPPEILETSQSFYLEMRSSLCRLGEGDSFEFGSHNGSSFPIYKKECPLPPGLLHYVLDFAPYRFTPLQRAHELNAFKPLYGLQFAENEDGVLLGLFGYISVGEERREAFSIKDGDLLYVRMDDEEVSSCSSQTSTEIELVPALRGYKEDDVQIPENKAMSKDVLLHRWDSNRGLTNTSNKLTHVISLEPKDGLISMEGLPQEEIIESQSMLDFKELLHLTEYQSTQNDLKECNPIGSNSLFYEQLEPPHGDTPRFEELPSSPMGMEESEEMAIPPTPPFGMMKSLQHLESQETSPQATKVLKEINLRASSNAKIMQASNTPLKEQACHNSPMSLTGFGSMIKESISSVSKNLYESKENSSSPNPQSKELNFESPAGRKYPESSPLSSPLSNVSNASKLKLQRPKHKCSRAHRESSSNSRPSFYEPSPSTPSSSIPYVQGSRHKLSSPPLRQTSQDMRPPKVRSQESNQEASLTEMNDSLDDIFDSNNTLSEPQKSYFHDDSFLKKSKGPLLPDDFLRDVSVTPGISIKDIPYVNEDYFNEGLPMEIVYPSHRNNASFSDNDDNGSPLDISSSCIMCPSSGLSRSNLRLHYADHYQKELLSNYPPRIIDSSSIPKCRICFSLVSKHVEHRHIALDHDVIRLYLPNDVYNAVFDEV